MSQTENGSGLNEIPAEETTYAEEIPAAEVTGAEVVPGAEASDGEISTEEEADAAETDDDSSEPAGNPGMRNALRTLIGLYLIYLGYSILKPVVKGEPVGMPLWVAIVFSILFILAGGGFVVTQLFAIKKRRDDENS